MVILQFLSMELLVKWQTLSLSLLFRVFEGREGSEMFAEVSETKEDPFRELGEISPMHGRGVYWGGDACLIRLRCPLLPYFFIHQTKQASDTFVSKY